MDGASISTRPRSALRQGDANRRQNPHSTSSANHRASTGLKTTAASPEVITSLITSLSAISTPAEDLFDSLLPIADTPSAPPSPTGQSFGGYAPVNPQASALGNGFLHPDDAAVSPVIRTSKPPSGYSPLTAPKKQPPHAGPSKWMNQEKGLSATIGNLSIEPGPRRSSASIASDGSGKSKSQKSLRVRASKERMREIDKDWKKKAREGSRSPMKSTFDETALAPDKRVRGGSRSPMKSSFEGHPLAPDSPRIGEFPNGFRDSIGLSAPIIPSRTHSVNRTSPSRRTSLQEDSPGGIGSGRSVPTRESSLRHSSPEAARGRRKRKSYRASQIPAEKYIEEASDESTTEKPDDMPGVEVPVEDSVTKRIRELKAQKEMREKTRSQSDDEGAQLREKHRQAKKKALTGRSSLPAPTSKPSATRSTSDSQLLSSTLSTANRGAQNDVSGKPRLSSVSQHSRPSMGSPLVEAHNRSASNPLTPGRKSSQMDDRPSTADSIDDAVSEYIDAPRLSHVIYHPQTGRAISFSEVGDPDGSVVFCCVGMGTTRFLTAFYDELALTLGLRLITPDRPGIGNSETHVDGLDTPLGWPDDIRSICQHLGISRFSILAHSAGAIYALATALRMPQHIRGRIHLLAPWIPPSQMVAIGIHQEPVPVTTLPTSQRFLRALPTPFLKAANSSFFSMTSTSITTSIQKSPRRSKRRSLTAADGLEPTTPSKTPKHMKRNSLPLEPERPMKSPSQDDVMMIDPEWVRLSEKQRQTEYDGRLTQAIWEAATTNANPAVDLLVCLERRQDIGFRYVDIRKAVVIHHGSRDSRVPVENIKWLANMMPSCELRVLAGEGHGLMASATVMSSVLTEMAKEWDDWNAVTRNKRR